MNVTTGEEVSILIRNVNLDYIGADDDIVFGTAEPNSTLDLQIGETHDSGFNLTVPVDGEGYWEVDLSAEGHAINGYSYASAYLYDAEGDTIIAQSPWINAQMSTDNFGTTNFSKNADVTLTLYDSPGGTVLYGPVTLRTEGSGSAWVSLWGTGIDLIPGNYITAYDHTLNFTKSLEVEPFTFDEINAADDYVRGTSSVGEWASLHVESLFSNWGLEALTDENGQWFRDYGLDNYDITEQMWASGWAVDYQGNRSEDHTTGLPGIEASLADDWISGFNFSPDRQVRVRIYESQGGSLLGDVMVNAGGNTQLNVDYWQHGVDLQPGMYILAEDLETGKYSELTLVNLTFDGVNYDADTAWGKAEPFARVVIRANHLFDNYEITVIADGSGDWLADFSSYGADINSEWNLRAMIFDLEFDATVAQAPEPPVFTASLDGNWVNGNNWTPNNNVSINIYESESGPSIGETFNWGTDNYGNFNANLWNEGVDLLPGNYITVTDTFSGVVKALALSNLTIDYLDSVNDVAGGLAPADTRLSIDFNNQQESIQFDLFSESDGTWEADFGDHDFDLQPGSSGNVRISDTDGDTIQVDGRVLTPYIEASPTGNWVHAREWLIGTIITMNISGSSDTYTATMGQAPWNPGDPNDIVADFDLQGYDVQAGDVITASANGITKTLTVSQLAVTNFDIEADTLSGVGTSGVQIQVCANVPNRCITRWVTPNSSGSWTANYHDPGTGNDDPDTFDVQPGSNGWAADRDEDGDQTWLDWNVPNPFLIAFPENEAVEGWEWPDGTVVHLTVDDPQTELSPDFEQDKVVAVTTWGDPRTYTRFDFADLYDLKVGDIVTVTDGMTYRTHIVQNLSVTVMDAATDTITGQANPGAVVVVWPHGFDQVATVQVTAGEDGTWLANLTGLHDLVGGTGGRSQIVDEAGNATAVDWNVPNPFISVRLDGNTVTGYDWPLETNITLTIDDPATTYTSVDYFATGQMTQAPWGETIVYFELNDLYTVKPGDIVTLQGGGHIRSHTVFHGLSFDSADVAADTISGTALDGASIQVNQCDDSGCADRYLENVMGGTWTVDFSVEGPRDEEKVLRDLQPGMGGEVWQFDEDGNSTVRSWYIPNPNFAVRTNFDQVEAYEWNLGTTLVLEINNPGNGPGVDYDDTQIVGAAPWAPDQTYVEFHFGGEYDLKPGDEVSLTDGSTTKTHIVTSLEITGFDIENDLVYGVAGPDSYINFVYACDDGNCSSTRHVHADSEGKWIADFGNPGDENDEQDTYDIVGGNWVDAQQGDEDGDFTFFGENVPNPLTLKGFYQPVDMNDVYNIVKGGSTVPLKFEIFAGSTELTDIAYIKSLTYTLTSCDTNATTDDIETITTGGTSLRYDTIAGQFIYNWKTPKTAGRCYRVAMTTLDGSTLMAYFKLK